MTVSVKKRIINNHKTLRVISNQDHTPIKNFLTALSAFEDKNTANKSYLAEAFEAGNVNCYINECHMGFVSQSMYRQFLAFSLS